MCPFYLKEGENCFLFQKLDTEKANICNHQQDEKKGNEPDFVAFSACVIPISSKKGEGKFCVRFSTLPSHHHHTYMRGGGKFGLAASRYHAYVQNILQQRLIRREGNEPEVSRGTEGRISANLCPIQNHTLQWVVCWLTGDSDGEF